MNDTQPKAINYYAAAGSGLAVTILTLGVLLGFSFLASVMFEGYAYNVKELVLHALIFLSVILFFALPTLVIGRHGWRTVVASFIIQAALITAAAFIGIAIFGDKSPNNYYDVTPSLRIDN